MELLSSVADEADFLYFSEDDYLYKKDAFRAMMDFLQNDGVDFVTPLDHPDRYSHIVAESVKSEVRVSPFCHWREVGTTCCTFMTTQKTFQRASRQISAYGRGAGDGATWLGITKDKIYSPRFTVVAAARYALGMRENWGEFVTLTAWAFHKWRLPFYRRYRLWGPMPSLAQHLCKPSLAPLWENGSHIGNITKGEVPLEMALHVSEFDSKCKERT